MRSCENPDVTIARTKEYVSINPDFQIHIADIYVKGDTVTIVGRPSGSCASPSKDVEIRHTHLYVCVVKDGHVVEFRHRNDTAAERKALGVSAHTRITEEGAAPSS